MRFQALPISMQAAAPMRLRYGYNLGGHYSSFASGPDGAKVRELIREAGMVIVRFFFFEISAPDLRKRGDGGGVFLDAVLTPGAAPMINLGGSPRDGDTQVWVRAFARRCCAVVRRSIERW